MLKKPNETDVVVGSRIRVRRKSLGLSQEKLGLSIGVTFQQIQKYEKGTNRVGASRLKDMARALDVPITYFFPENAGDEDRPALEHFNVRGAAELLACYAEITQPALKKAVLDLARALRRAEVAARDGSGATNEVESSDYSARN